MLQGTASHVGKSALATALCRILKQDGYRVAPFKSWNMALNSYVTRDGGEIGRAQGEQAMACGIGATVDMNPVLVKPKGEGEAQVILRGRPWKDRKVGIGEDLYRETCWKAIQGSLAVLQENYEILVIEGAGSPAEINLREGDLANMRVALETGFPVLLVADIDRGGALAAVVGTMMLLAPEERELVAGFIFNKFRGDIRILEPGLRIVEERTGKPVLGVIPYIREMNLAAEDGVALEQVPREKRGRGPTPGEGPLDLAVIKLPRISNFTDFQVLEQEPGVNLYYLEPGEELGSPDCIILPGSKNSVADLVYLDQVGCSRAVVEAAGKGIPVIGICGGYQMLGRELRDPRQAESSHGTVAGLGLLDTVTTFYPEKETCQVEARAAGGLLGLFPTLQGQVLEGYEIHMGQTELLPGAVPALTVTRRLGRDQGARAQDGAVGWAGAAETGGDTGIPGESVTGGGNRRGKRGLILGTYLHGIFDNPSFRQVFLGYLRALRGGLPGSPGDRVAEDRGPGEKGVTRQDCPEKSRDRAYDRLAQTVRENLDMEAVYRAIHTRARRE